MATTGKTIIGTRSKETHAFGDDGVVGFFDFGNDRILNDEWVFADARRLPGNSTARDAAGDIKNRSTKNPPPTVHAACEEQDRAAEELFIGP